MGEPCADETRASTRWGIVAARIIHNPRLTVCARMVYASMATRARVDGQVEVAQTTMARDLNMSRAWVNGGVKELEKMGLVRVERVFVEGLQRPSRYHLIDGLRKGAGPVVTPGAHDPEAGTVGEATSTAPEDDSGESGGWAGRRCQPVDGAPQHAERQRCQPADTSHDSRIQDSLPRVRERAGRSRDQAPPASPGISPDCISPDWRPSEDDLAWARTRMPDLDAVAYTEAFVMTCLAKGYRYADPGFGWRLWIADPKKPLPILASKPQTPMPGDTDHDGSSIRFQAPGHFPGGQRKSFRNGAEDQRKTFSGGSGTGQGPGDLRALNAGRAAACLGRILERRAVRPSA